MRTDRIRTQPMTDLTLRGEYILSDVGSDKIFTYLTDLNVDASGTGIIKQGLPLTCTLHCHYRWLSLYPLIFSITIPNWRRKNGHCVTVTGVTVSGRHCTFVRSEVQSSDDKKVIVGMQFMYISQKMEQLSHTSCVTDGRARPLRQSSWWWRCPRRLHTFGWIIVSKIAVHWPWLRSQRSFVC